MCMHSTCKYRYILSFQPTQADSIRLYMLLTILRLVLKKLKCARTSCGGTSKVTVLKSTTLTLSRQGSMKKSPGPLALPDVSRPRRRITALSYSFTIYACAGECAYIRTIIMQHGTIDSRKVIYRVTYLDGYKQRKWEEHNDHDKRNHGHHVAAASQTLLSRCSYFGVCRGEKIAHKRSLVIAAHEITYAR